MTTSNEHNNAPAVAQGEPVAWKYELAVRINAEGRGSGWCRRLTDYKPSVPDGMIRNLRPLTYADAAPAVPQGWKLVPVEPSPEMMEAMPGMPAIGAPGDMDLKNKGWSLKAIQNRHRWIAALAAAPTPAPAQDVGLTDEEIKHVCAGIYLSDHPQGSASYDVALARAIIAALRAKGQS